MPGRRSSLSVDDEGTPTRRNVLIEDGVLRGYMQDSLNARLMKNRSRQKRGVVHPPTLPRMTNTDAAGKDDPADIIRSVKKGLYATNRRQPGRHHQRQVRILRRRGVPDRGQQGDLPVKGATLIGKPTRSPASHDRQRLALDGIGTCGKEGKACRWASPADAARTVHGGGPPEPRFQQTVFSRRRAVAADPAHSLPCRRTIPAGDEVVAFKRRKT
jgi:TldD protein